MLQRHEAKIHHLHPRPQRPVGAHHGRPLVGQLLAHAAALERGHGGEEHGGVDGGEDQLVAADLGEDLGVGAAQPDRLLQELEPDCCGGPEDGC